jgi:hypothetical protein
MVSHLQNLTFGDLKNACHFGQLLPVAGFLTNWKFILIGAGVSTLVKVSGTWKYRNAMRQSTVAES